MNDPDHSPIERGRTRCPLCGGSGDYYVAPVGHVLCPECEDGISSMKRPGGRNERE
jgi:uncharacterized protein (UPF0212 family)